MADNLFQNILKISKLKMPLPVLKSFNQLFPDAINVEWHYTDKVYEAVFYDNELEKIIRIEKNGKWLDTKINLPLRLLPEHISIAACIEGEIMNAISIFEGIRTFYELIVRDKDLKRYLALYDDSAELITKVLL
jgi:hypothetical protein